VGHRMVCALRGRIMIVRCGIPVPIGDDAPAQAFIHAGVALAVYRGALVRQMDPCAADSHLTARAMATTGQPAPMRIGAGWPPLEAGGAYRPMELPGK